MTRGSTKDKFRGVDLTGMRVTDDGTTLVGDFVDQVKLVDVAASACRTAPSRAGTGTVPIRHTPISSGRVVAARVTPPGVGTPPGRCRTSRRCTASPPPNSPPRTARDRARARHHNFPDRTGRGGGGTGWTRPGPRGARACSRLLGRGARRPRRCRRHADRSGCRRRLPGTAPPARPRPRGSRRPVAPEGVVTVDRRPSGLRVAAPPASAPTSLRSWDPRYDHGPRSGREDRARHLRALRGVIGPRTRRAPRPSLASLAPASSPSRRPATPARPTTGGQRRVRRLYGTLREG